MVDAGTHNIIIWQQVGLQQKQQYIPTITTNKKYAVKLTEIND
jgi:hypothetical protein